ERTPARVAKAYEYLTSGYQQRVEDVLNDALFTEEYDEMVVVKDIDYFSLCEHHLLPFFGRAHIAYMPSRKIVGLSKIPRLGEVFSRRLQGRGRLTTQIAHTIYHVPPPRGPPYHRRLAPAARSRGGCRGPTPLHAHARGGEAELQGGDLRHARRIPRPAGDARGVHAA